MADFKLFLESSLKDLYDSTVMAFPRTAARQHSIQPIRITQMHWTPFVGLKTLFLRGLAVNEGRHYNPIILFKKVNFQPVENASVAIVASDGRQYYLEQLSSEDSSCQCRCQCKDFFWRFQHANSISSEKVLYGPDRKPYISKGIGTTANPENAIGACKHILKLVESLHHAGLVS